MNKSKYIKTNKTTNIDFANPDSESVQEAARWMAKMAATDGMVTPSERVMLKEFTEAYGIFVSINSTTG